MGTGAGNGDRDMGTGLKIGPGNGNTGQGIWKEQLERKHGMEIKIMGLGGEMGI